MQHHDTIVTGADVGLRVRCNYNLTDRTVTQSSDLQVDDGGSGGNQEDGAMTTAVEAPNVTMRITDR